ncbi:MAG: S8 family serine peptidase [Acidobacteriota bacterium]
MRFIPFVLMFALLVVPAASADPSIDSKIAPELLSQLEAGSQKALEQSTEAPVYRIVVDLRQRAVRSQAQMAQAFATQQGHDMLMADVADLQQGVLDSLARKAEVTTFEVWNRYQSTYGFSAYADADSIRALAAHGDVTYVQELPLYVKMDAEAHAITNVDNAHAGGTTGAGVTIAVIDDGIDHDHAAFGGSSAWPNSKILGGRDFADNDNNPRIDCTAQSHGTAVTGVAVGNGGGITGSAPDAKAVFLKIQSASICGQPALDGDIPGAIDWAVTNRNNFSPAIKIISMSLGTNSTFTSPCSSIAESGALAAARSAGMVTLIASGNGAVSNGIASPACHPDAVSVGATYDANIGSPNFGLCSDSTTFADKITCYSNSDTFLDILAPAHCARTANAGGGQEPCFGGTSSATPYAAGVTALIFETNSGISRNAAVTALKAGTNITDSRNGVTKPRVDGPASIAAAGGSGGGGGGGGGTCNGTNCIDWDSTATSSFANQDASSSFSVSNGGDTITLSNNTWRRTNQTFNITANTRVEFQFSSSSQGEIHGIGFDEDNVLSSNRIFKVHGTQNYGITNFDNYTSGITTYDIPVGQFFTGSSMNLILVNDQDSGSGANSVFTNVRVYESGGGGGGGSCAYDNDFESGDTAGWSTGGSCTTGTYILGNPTQQTATVVTQPNGSASGSSSIFTASNTSAGNADVDGGNCTLSKDAISVSSSSTLSFNYFHGQRDTGDDASGDFFNVQYRVNGGSWQTVVSNGDSRSTASWTAASATVPAGSIELRVQCSDGAGPGDIIECGIDDVTICN